MEAYKLAATKRLEENVSKPCKLFIDFVNEYLALRRNRTERYKNMYRSTLNHVRDFCQLNNLPEPYTNDIDMEFCEQFIHYLQTEKKHMQNTVKGNLERLHAMLHKAALYGYPVNNTYEEVTVPQEEAGSVFLSMTEITRIYYYEGLPTYRIMLITGHKSESSFFKYIRVTREENTATLSGHLFFQ